MKETILALVGSLLSTSVGLLYKYLTSPPLNWPVVPGIIIVGILSGFITAMFIFIFKTPWFRRRFSKIKNVDGHWSVKVLAYGDRPISICTVEVTGDGYSYKGYGINADGTKGSTWASKEVTFHEQSMTLQFVGDARITDTNKRIVNYGFITFSHNGDRVEGDGYFVDMGDDLRQSEMLLEPLTEEEYSLKLHEMNERTEAKASGKAAGH
jgi:hypothetical protein